MSGRSRIWLCRAGRPVVRHQHGGPIARSGRGVRVYPVRRGHCAVLGTARTARRRPARPPGRPGRSGRDGAWIGHERGQASRRTRLTPCASAGLFPWPVPQPFLRPLRLSVALVDNRYLLGPLEVRLADQRVGDEEFGEVTLMVLFLPDPALQLLLIIRDGALAAQVQGDGDLDHRDGLRCYRAENVLLVVVGHGHASGAIAIKEGTDL